MPHTHRHHGDPFNLEYEQWARKITGGPPDLEYRVEHGGEEAWFDATVVENRGDRLVEVLVDAKGRYAQFLDDRTGDWKPWWRNSEKGLGSMSRTARRQVRVANGRPVEWYCAEEAAADALADAFYLVPELRGRIRVVHKPMPETEG